MSKLKEEELLEFLDRFYCLWREWMQKKTTMPNMLKLAGEAHQQIKEMIQKKPEVTQEFVKKWAEVIHCADTGLFGIKGELKLLRQMLKEAGVEVVK